MKMPYTATLSAEFKELGFDKQMDELKFSFGKEYQKEKLYQ
jgi:hypothetical protein